MGDTSNRWLSVRENSSQKHRQVSGQQPKTTAAPVDNDHFIDAVMMARIRQIAAGLRREIDFYRAVASHSRTPRLARWLLGAAVAYALMPFDLIPDFVPVLGHVDDLLIVPGLIIAGLWLVPQDVVAECRGQQPPA
jgi:uncharacterized membrane protein YkvA (DUF1232 family)